MPDHDPVTVTTSRAFVPNPLLVRRSRDLLRELQAPNGAYPASPTFSAYQGHSWFRDGAFIAEAARRHGDLDGSARFHVWCAQVILDRREHIADIIQRGRSGLPVGITEMLPTRYTMDGDDGTDAWWDFQLDGYGTWLWALAEHTESAGPPAEECATAAALVLDYLTTFWDLPCYDWWEEHVEHRHIATLGAIRAGMGRALALPAVDGMLDDAQRDRVRAALTSLDATLRDEGLSPIPRPGSRGPHLVKWKGSDLLDASLLACVEPFRIPLPDGVAEATVDAVEQDLAADGGVHRYLLDTYYGGGQWLLLSGFLAWCRISQGRLSDAARYLIWIEEQADEALHLPEQVTHHLLDPAREQEWIDRWGASASPLLWSHAMYLIACDAWSKALDPDAPGEVIA